jgi:hypothetical protein
MFNGRARTVVAAVRARNVVKYCMVGRFDLDERMVVWASFSLLASCSQWNQVKRQKLKKIGQ